MKMRKHYLLLLFAVLFSNSCIKNNTGIISVPYENMDININGKKWSAVKITGSVITIPGDSELVITGEAGNSQKIQFHISGYPLRGGVHFVNDYPPTSIIFYKSSVDTIDAIEGQVLLNHIHVDTIDGTFSFKTADSTIGDGGTYSVILSH